MSATQHTPGPWFVHENKGTGGWLPGFYAGREVQPGVNEWMQDAKRRIARFSTEVHANAAIAGALRRQIVAHGRARPAAEGEASGLHYVQCQCERCSEAVVELARVAKATGSAA